MCLAEFVGLKQMRVQTIRAMVLSLVLPVLAGNGCNSPPESAGDGDRPAAAAAPAESNAVASSPPVLTPEHVYEVHKKVRDFPPGEDLSTPEAAYATIHRAYAANGDAAWMPLNSPKIIAQVRRRGFQPRIKGPLPAEEAKLYLGAEILEVHTWDHDYAMVMAAMPRKGYDIDCRSLARVKGRWLNDGNDCTRTIDEARQRVAAQRAYQYGSHFREAMRKRVPSPPATTGKVIELSDVSSRLASMANLAKGTAIVPDPSRFRGDTPEGIAWMREQGIDLIAYARTDNGDEGVAGYDMAAVKIDHSRFDVLDASEARRVLTQIKDSPPATMMSTKRELPVTYVIRTRAGMFGVLQIEDVRSEQAPAVFRLRYKLFD